MKSIFLSAFICLTSVFHVHAETSNEDFKKAVMDAYIYGFPLVLMDVTKNVLIATPTLNETKAPINQFLNKRTFPDPSFKEIVSPNADTLYTQAWLDLSKDPIIFTAPDMGNRYYLFPMLDEWTNVFFSPGTRTTGNSKNSFAITGPHWKGILPNGVQEVKAPTDIVWIIGRIQTNGASDFAAVNKLQDKFKLTPLRDWDTNYVPPSNVPYKSIDSKTPPIDQVLKMDGITFFTKLSELLKNASPPSQDTEYVRNFSKLGLIPGHSFDKTSVSSFQMDALNDAVKKAQTKIKKDWDEHPFATTENGWGVIRSLVGNYGTNYDVRAAVAFGGLGANLPEDAIYPATNVDSSGQPLDGKNRYTMHFDKAPPVKAFWSLTMYDDHHFFTANPIKRYAIGDRDKLKINPDGSFDIYIQNTAPGHDQDSNWLPAPVGKFNLLLRFYNPSDEIINGNWKPPEVTKVAK